MMENNNNLRPNVLFVDDQPVGATLSQIIVPLKQQYHVEVVRKPQEAWEKLQSPPPENGWQMVMLDLQLDAPMPSELQQYVQRLKGATTLDYSGQAIGLYLWAQRKARQIPYAYISTFAHLWQPVQASDEGVEFAGANEEDDKKLLVCNRGTQGDACEYVGKILKIWETYQWTTSRK